MNLMNHKDRYFGAFVFSESMVPVPVISLIYKASISSSDKPVISDMKAIVKPIDFILRAMEIFAFAAPSILALFIQLSQSRFAFNRKTSSSETMDDIY